MMRDMQSSQCYDHANKLSLQNWKINSANCLNYKNSSKEFKLWEKIRLIVGMATNINNLWNNLFDWESALVDLKVVWEIFPFAFAALELLVLF